MDEHEYIMVLQATTISPETISKWREDVYKRQDFPSIHITLKTNEYKLYFLSEIEEYVQKFQKTNIIPSETPLNKEQINKIGIR